MRAPRIRAPVGYLDVAGGEECGDERSRQPPKEPRGRMLHLVEIPEAREKETSKGERDHNAEEGGQEEIESDPSRPQARHRRHGVRPDEEEKGGEKKVRSGRTRRIEPVSYTHLRAHETRH